MNDERKRYSIDIDELGVDWNAQRVKINERIRMKEKPAFFSFKLARAGVVLVAVMAFAITWFTIKAPVSEVEIVNVDLASAPEEIYVDDMPSALYVLNGFDDEDDDFDDTMSYIVPSIDQ